MNLKERLFWIAGIMLIILFAQQKSHKVDDLQTLITTYQLESNIQDSQISDISQQFTHAQRLEYDRGFEAGRTQAAIILMNKSSLYNYTDGYHAAISQFGIANPDDENKAYLNIITDMSSNKEEE
jgi:hypothetical protein